MNVERLAPSECAERDLDAFRELVLAGGEVAAQGLAARIRRAERLVFAREGSVVVGVAGLKRPTPAYRESVFHKARVSHPDACPLELGWVFVVPAHRGTGVSRALVEVALEGVSDGVFATSWVDNTRMHRSLTRNEFSATGQPYDSDLSDRQLKLFVRAGRPTRG